MPRPSPSWVARGEGNQVGQGATDGSGVECKIDATVAERCDTLDESIAVGMTAGPDELVAALAGLSVRSAP